MEILDDLHGEGVGLKDSDLRIDGGAIFRVFNQGRTDALETEHASIVFTVKDNAADGLVLRLHEEGSGQDEDDDDSCEGNHCPFAIQDIAPQSRYGDFFGSIARPAMIPRG